MAPNDRQLLAFITGATGFVGRALVDELLAQEWQVRALVRNKGRRALLPSAVSVVQGTVTDDAALLAGTAEADVVFHLAAAISGDWQKHADVTVGGTARVLHACHQAGVRRLVLVSSIVVYDKTRRAGDAVLDETAPLLRADESAGAYARSKLEVEKLASEYANREDSLTEIVILRPGLVYGKNRLTFPHLGELVGQTRVGYGSRSLLLPLVEAGSCADAMVRAATSPAAAGKTYNIVDSYYPTRREYLSALAGMKGPQPRTSYLPVWPVAAAAAAISSLGRITGSQVARHISAEKIRARALELRYDTTAIEKDTGWRPLPDFEQGLSRIGLSVRRGAPRDIRNVGIVGAGRISRLHLMALRSIPGVRVAGILDPNLKAAQELAAYAGGVPIFDTARQFYNEIQPQLVHVLTPPRSHRVVAAEALRRGAHVLLEKPATATVREADALLEEAAAGGLTIGVDETVAWDPLVRRARTALISGVLGEPVHVDVFMGFDLSRGNRLEQIQREESAAWERTLPGGLLEDLLPHPLSVVRTLCGVLPLRHRESMVTGRLPYDLPDELRLSLGNAALTATISMSLSSRPDDFVVLIYGTRASLRIDVQNMLYDCATPLAGPRGVARGLRVLRSAARTLGQTAGNGLRLALRKALPPASPAHLIRQHYAALARGDPPPAPLDEARHDIEIIRAIWPEPPSPEIVHPQAPTCRGSALGLSR